MLPTHKGDYPRPDIALPGKRALIITTSHRTLDKLCPTTGQILKPGKPTGVYASEMTEPYYVFRDTGLDVDLASIKGGPIPIEKMSLNPLIRTRYDSRFLKDAEAVDKAEHSLCIDDLDFTQYDVIFIAGGWGAAYDLAQSDALSQKITEAHAHGVLLGSVCHGALGFIGATKPDRSPLVKGVEITAVTNRQIKQLGISATPKHPETELRKAGANYVSTTKLIEMTANHVAVDTRHRIVSAQNQKGGVEAAVKALELLVQATETKTHPQAA